MSSALSNPFVLILIGTVAVAAVGMYLLYFFDRAFIKKRISKIDFIILLFIFVLPAYTSINANISFDQSIIDGVFSTWAKHISLLLVVIYQFFIRAKRVSVKSVYFVVLCMAWVTMLSKVYLTLTLNPATLVDTDMVGYNPAKGGYVFRFDATVEQVAVIFYFTSFIITKRWYHLLGFGAFLSYMLFVDKGRIDIMSLFVVMGFSMIRNLSAINFVRTSLILGTLATVGIVVVYQFAPDQIIVLRNMLGNFVLTVVGVDTGENSASSRFIQFGIVFNHFIKHPEQMIFGVGILQRETMSLMFGHLYLSDIGIVGLFFTFGIVGVIILYSLFIYALRMMWSIRYYKQDLYYKLTESIMVLLFVSSFFNGAFIWAPGGFLTFLLFLHTFTLMEKSYVHRLSLQS
ncbi:MAG: hypothetical protein R2730_15555 [Chitinophagales bacterium]